MRIGRRRSPLLKGLLLLPPEAQIAPAAPVNLDVLAPELPAPSWDAVLAARPDLRALEAEVREAEAEIQIARALRWPDATPAVRYSREEGTPIVWGGLTITLPILNSGTGERLAAEARLRRAEVELESTRASVEADLRVAYDVVPCASRRGPEPRRDHRYPRREPGAGPAQLRIGPDRAGRPPRRAPGVARGAR